MPPAGTSLEGESRTIDVAAPRQRFAADAFTVVDPLGASTTAEQSYDSSAGDRNTKLHLRSVLRHDGGLTWMLAGDSLEPSAALVREWRGFGGRLTETIRHTLGRRRDVVIDQLTPEHTLSQTVSELTAAVPRFQPDLVLVSLGAHEAEAGRRGLPAFERSLLELIHATSRRGAIPILCTPPRVPTAEAEATVDQLIYAEAVRSIAAEYDVPLVDHFAHWEAAAASAKGNAAWFDAVAPLPGRYGHQQLVQRIVSDLSLEPEAAKVVRHRQGHES